MTVEPIIQSMLDSDLYKFTMMQAVLFQYQDVDVEYKFINRGGTNFPDGFDRLLREQIESMASLRLARAEASWMRVALPYLKRAFIDFLTGYQYDPREVAVSLDRGHLRVHIQGPWYRTILWEVPLMALISELYFKQAGIQPEKDYRAKMVAKGARLQDSGVYYADFGTRRRFSREIQHDAVWCHKASTTFTGTSNVALAKKHGLRATGTHAHEWFSALAAMFGYPLANRYALEAWGREYHGDLGIALTDTFTTDVFFAQFGMAAAKQFDGVRHDSGDPITFAEKTIVHYKSLNIDPMSKVIVFSDGLNPDEAIRIKNWCDNRIKCAFGIGTNLTNDVGATPLNMVIKMINCSVNGKIRPVVKLSDVSGKHTGDIKEIEVCKHILGVS